MNIDYIKSFCKELKKLAGLPLGSLDAGLGLLSIGNDFKASKAAASRLGKAYTPMTLKPTTNYTFDAGQYNGKRI